MSEKHFLDTSVLRPLLTSPQKVKDYYKECLPGDKYICEYIKMEFLRGYIQTLINFYFLLAMPQINNISDALSFWSNKFQIREQKNILIMISNMFQNYTCVNDKDKSKNYLADYIRRLIGKLHLKYKEVGNDNTYCPKGKLKLNFDPLKIEESFNDFLNLLSNNNAYLKCKINDFVQVKYKSSFDKIVKNKTFIGLKNNSEGFNKICENIDKIAEKQITCNSCSKIGDAIISIISDSNWRLEHTDYSYDFLCEILDKKHYRHPNDTKLM